MTINLTMYRKSFPFHDVLDWQIPYSKTLRQELVDATWDCLAKEFPGSQEELDEINELFGDVYQVRIGIRPTGFLVTIYKEE